MVAMKAPRGHFTTMKPICVQDPLVAATFEGPMAHRKPCLVEGS
jgi:hypothetical protein